MPETNGKTDMLVALFQVPSSTATDLLATVSGQFTDPGTWLVVLAVIAIPLVFYIIKRIIGLFPKR